MSIESEGNFNQAMAMGNMLRGAAGVVSLNNNKIPSMRSKPRLPSARDLVDIAMTTRFVVSTNNCCYNASLHDFFLLMPIIITIIFRLSTMRVQNAPMQIIVVL
jgi:hypothetical protein